ncbi:hypothetical protein [Thermodesulforhabdus norvegica]|uniref:hypothetical protein n=1 Tax=Thermodesulforhabdus norvegica TaxID=39841 RepID=UPI001160C44C|nr:hypothetical protein [Thermodesulforhabdus norvegica]
MCRFFLHMILTVPNYPGTTADIEYPYMVRRIFGKTITAVVRIGKNKLKGDRARRMRATIGGGEGTLRST